MFGPARRARLTSRDVEARGSGASLRLGGGFRSEQQDKDKRGMGITHR